MNTRVSRINSLDDAKKEFSIILHSCSLKIWEVVVRTPRSTRTGSRENYASFRFLFAFDYNVHRHRSISAKPIGPTSEFRQILFFNSWQFQWISFLYDIVLNIFIDYIFFISYYARRMQKMGEFPAKRAIFPCQKYVLVRKLNDFNILILFYFFLFCPLYWLTCRVFCLLKMSINSITIYYTFDEILSAVAWLFIVSGLLFLGCQLLNEYCCVRLSLFCYHLANYGLSLNQIVALWVLL